MTETKIHAGQADWMTGPPDEIGPFGKWMYRIDWHEILCIEDLYDQITDFIITNYPSLEVQCRKRPKVVPTWHVDIKASNRKAR